jgi:hypothetical protein
MGIIRMSIPAKIDGDKIVKLLRMPGVAETTLTIKRIIYYQGTEFEADDDAAIVSLLRGLAGFSEAGGKGADETKSVTEPVSRPASPPSIDGGAPQSGDSQCSK